MKVHVWQDPASLCTNITIVEERDNEVYICEPFELKFTKYDMGTRYEPSLRLSGLVAQQFLQSFQQSLSEQGIKTVNENKLEGILEATKQHLEDMRTLVFKEKL